MEEQGEREIRSRAAEQAGKWPVKPGGETERRGEDKKIRERGVGKSRRWNRATLQGRGQSEC